MPRLSSIAIASLITCLAGSVWAVDGSTPEVRVGLGVGVFGQLPVGGDVGQPGVSEDEFESGLGLHVEVLTLDFGRAFQLVPFVRVTLAGAVNEAVYEDVVGASVDLAEVSDADMTQLGLGGRYYPFDLGTEAVRLFAGLYASYVTAGAEYAVNDVDPALIPGAFSDFVGPTVESRRHHGLGLGLGVGIRGDLPFQALDDAFWVPFTLEVFYTKNIWLDLEESADRGIDSSLLSPENMSLDSVGVLLTVGLMK
jgi:hypothetical protein